MLINPKIVEIFKKTKNIQRTALEAGVSVVTVRRTLLTVGEWSSPKSREIAVLLEEGLSYREIADRLCTTVGAVEAYSPYRVGNYHNNTPSNEGSFLLSLIHKSWHGHYVPTVIGHFQITHQAGIGQGLFSKPPADVFYGILQTRSTISLLGVYEH